MFLGTLKPLYYEKLLIATARSFSKLVMTGEALDVAIRIGKIEGRKAPDNEKG